MRILADPGATLAKLAAGDVKQLLQAIAGALGVDATHGLALPGGIVLGASGNDPLRLELTGSLDLDAAGDTLTFDLGLAISADRRVAPDGTLTLDVKLPGDWGRVKVAFSASTTGVGLVVTPQGAAAITLLPQFTGFGSLAAAGATRLLPQLLQRIVDELRPAAGPPAGALAAALALATDLQIYADDAQGFEEPARAARLAAMLQPGWIEHELADPAATAGLDHGLLRPRASPHGPDRHSPGRQRRPHQLDGAAAGRAGTITLTVALGTLAVLVAVDGLDAGPLTIDHALVGFDAGLVFDLALALDPGGDLAFLEPVVELDVANDRLSAALLPLGPTRRADLSFGLAPLPTLTFTPDGALGLLVEWGLPLVAMLALGATGSVLDEALWTNGPTARDILEGAGLLVPDPTHGTPHLVSQLPALDALALGAVEALATNLVVSVSPTLDVAIVDDGTGRKGVRLKGVQDIDAGDMTVSMSFGFADWLDDPDRGVTLWLLHTAAGKPPALDPGLEAVGLGAMFANTDASPLLDGALAIGRAGGLLFFALDFLDGTGQPAVSVSDLGAAIDLRDAQIAVVV